MSYANGQIPSSALKPIHGGLLRADAAAAFNAMDAEAVRRYGRHIGVRDSYRPLGHPGDLDAGRWSQWAAKERQNRGGNLAATPGTSNHGLGLAVDLDSDGIWIVHQIGHRYGWAKEWSDAPSEDWHFKFRTGVWKSPPKKYRYQEKGALTHINALFAARKGMRKEEKTGKGVKYTTHLKSARAEKAWLLKEANRLYDAGKKKGWSYHHIGTRQKEIRDIVNDGSRVS